MQYAKILTQLKRHRLNHLMIMDLIESIDVDKDGQFSWQEQYDDYVTDGIAKFDSDGDGNYTHVNDTAPDIDGTEGNGQWDEGENYNDTNENGQWDAAEFAPDEGEGDD